MTSNIEIKIFHNINPELEEIWKNNNNFNYIFQSLEYIKIHLNNKKTKPNVQKFFLLVMFNNQPYYILPLETVSIFSCKIVRWIGNHEFDYCAPVVLEKADKTKLDKCGF